MRDQARFPVILGVPDKVGDGQHADIGLFVRVPQRTGSHSSLHHGVQRFLQGQLVVQDDQLGVGLDDVVTPEVCKRADDDVNIVITFALSLLFTEI